MPIKLTIGLIGSLVLLAGLFAPIVCTASGCADFYGFDKVAGRFVFCFAIASIVLVVMKKPIGLWVTGLGSFGIMVYAYKTMNPYIRHGVRYEWGWLLLIIGALLIIVCAALNNKETTRHDTAS